LYWLPPENGYRACHMWRVPRTGEVKKPGTIF